MARGVKKKDRQKRKTEQIATPIHPSIRPSIRPSIHHIPIHSLAHHSYTQPTTTHITYCPIYLWKEKPGRKSPGLVAVFFFLFLCAFRGLLQHCLGGYLSFTSPGASSVLYHHHIVAFYLSLLFFFTFSFIFFLCCGSSRECEYRLCPDTLPSHTHTYTVCSLFCPATPTFFLFFHALRSLLHAYHSLLVWPLYQQPLSFLCEHSTQPIAHHPHFLASSSDCNVKTHKVELKDAQYI